MLCLTSCRSLYPRVNWVKHSIFRSKFKSEIRQSFKFVLHEVWAKVSIAIHHLLASVPDPLLNYNHRCSCHDQSADSVVPESVHTSTVQTELAKQRVKMLSENSRIHERGLPS